MIIDFRDLGKHDFEISGVDIIHQMPKYRRLVANYRSVNGFLVIIRGSCHYYFEGGEFTLGPDSVVYLPLGSRHVLEIDSDVFEFFRIDFTLKIGGELALFSDLPKKMCNTVSKEGKEAVRALMDASGYSKDTIRRTELMCTIFRTLSVGSDNVRAERLSPALSYLIDHLSEGVDCSLLAKLCHLSSSQFYNLFREEYKTSPLAYRDALIIQKAKTLLQDMFSVTSVAEMLGFESVSYFSRFFKKHCGVPPLKYQRSTVNADVF